MARLVESDPARETASFSCGFSMSAVSSIKAAIGDSPLPLLELSDAEFLSALKWRRGASAGLAEASRSGDVAAFEVALRQAFAAQSRPRSKKLPGMITQVDWMFSGHELSLSEAELQAVLTIALDDSRTSGSQEAALAESITDFVDVAESLPTLPARLAIGCLTLLHQLADQIPDGTLFRLWRLTLTAAMHVAVTPAECEFDPADAAATLPVEFLLTHGELPFRGAILFRDLAGSADWGRAGRNELRRQLSEQLDTDGTPHASLFPQLHQWIGCFVRATFDAQQSSTPLWTSSHQELLSDCAIKSAAMCGSTLMGVDGFEALLALGRLTGSRGKSPQLRSLKEWLDWECLSPAERSKKQKKRQRSKKKIEPHWNSISPGTQSDWAELALLRNYWGPQADRCLVTYDGTHPKLQFSASCSTFLDGPWGLTVEVDGTAIDIPAEWESSCWFSDADCDFVELRLSLTEEIALLRQIVLVRNEGLMFLCDIVNGGRTERPLRVTSRLPLAGGVEVEQDSLTREIQLVQDGMRARLFSLSAPADRSQGASCEIVSNGDELVITRSALSGLAIPLLLAWTPGVLQQPADWSPLTVAEDGKPVPPSEACGGRLRIGSRQWFYYHCLNDGEFPRSVLGHHTAAETLFARFPPDGSPDFLLVVNRGEENSPEVVVLK